MNTKAMIALLNRGAAAIETPADLTDEHRLDVASELAALADQLSQTPGDGLPAIEVRYIFNEPIEC